MYSQEGVVGCHLQDPTIVAAFYEGLFAVVSVLLSLLEFENQSWCMCLCCPGMPWPFLEELPHQLHGMPSQTNHTTSCRQRRRCGG